MIKTERINIYGTTMLKVSVGDTSIVCNQGCEGIAINKLLSSLKKEDNIDYSKSFSKEEDIDFGKTHIDKYIIDKDISNIICNTKTQHDVFERYGVIKKVVVDDKLADNKFMLVFNSDV